MSFLAGLWGSQNQSSAKRADLHGIMLNIVHKHLVVALSLFRAPHGLQKKLEESFEILVGSQ